MNPRKPAKIDILFVDVLPYIHSTRTRKMASVIARRFDGVRAHALTLQRVGRTGIEDQRSGFSEFGVSVEQLATPAPAEARSFRATVHNLVFVYANAFGRLAKRTLTTRARLIVVGNTALIPLAAVYAALYRVPVIVSARERLGGVRTPGSIGTSVSRIEPALVQFLRREGVTVITVAEGHAEEYSAAGAKEVLTLRNLPLASFLPQELPALPPNDELVVVLVGSLYAGRGIEPLIQAIGIARAYDIPVRLEITGRGSIEYVEGLERLIEDEGVRTWVRMLGPCAPHEVTARYARGHIGTALYEGVDRANDSLSNKLFESVAAGRPVLAGDLPENTRTVRKYGLGWTSPVTAVDLARQLGEIYHSLPSLDARALHCLEVSRQTLNWEEECSALLAKVGRLLNL